MNEPEVQRCDGCGHWHAVGTLHDFTIGVSAPGGHMKGGKVSLCSACARAVRAATPRRNADRT